jgi:hypothetical protein
MDTIEHPSLGTKSSQQMIYVGHSWDNLGTDMNDRVTPTLQSEMKTNPSVKDFVERMHS